MLVSCSRNSPRYNTENFFLNFKISELISVKLVECEIVSILDLGKFGSMTKKTLFWIYEEQVLPAIPEYSRRPVRVY